MKKTVATWLTICVLVIAVTLSSAIPAAAYTSQNRTTPQINYSELLSQAEFSDGAESERVAGELANAFDADPEGILSAMASCPENQLDIAVMLLVYGKSYDDFNAFEQSVLQRKALSQDDAAKSRVLDKILDEIMSFNDTESFEGLTDNTLTEPPMFQPDIIRSFIERHDYTSGADESFFGLMADVYRLEPELLEEIVCDMDSYKVDYIARGIAYDVIKHGNYTAKNAAPSENYFSALVEATIANNNVDLSTFWTSEVSAAIGGQVDSYAAQSAVTIGNIHYTTTPLRLEESENLSVTYKNPDTGSARTYVTKIFLVYNKVPVQVSTKTVIIPPGVNTLPQSYTINFSQWGPVYTLVRVYAQDGETLLASQQSGSSDTVYGKWEIDISLPENRNNKGTLALYDARGYRKMYVECLGRSGSNASMYVTNGNTPTGTYTGVLDGHRAETDSYGPYQVVSMIGVQGAIIDSRRSGIMIHGGSPATNSSLPYYPLRQTYGCVRISNDNQSLLETKITDLIGSTGYHEERGKIIIDEK